MQDKILRQLRNGKPINSEMIEELLSDYTSIATKTEALWKRYLGDAPILKRTVPEYVASNERLANDFFGLVVNNKVGYFSGIPINYSIDKTKYEINEEPSTENQIPHVRYKAHTNTVNEFILRNNMHDLDSEMVKILAATGYGVRKYYTDKQGNTRTVNLKPFEVIVLSNEHKEVEYALRFFKSYNSNDEEVTYIEFYDESSITYFVENSSKDKGDSKYILNSEYATNPQEHVFDYCPFVYFQNNEESMSDVEKVLPLIDSYNTVLSNNNNELNGFALAYMYLKNGKLTPELVANLKQLGALEIPEGAELGYLTKTLDATFGDSFLDRVQDNIFQFTQSVNFNDEKFNSTSGIALKYKLQALNDKCIALEAKFKRSLAEQFKIITSAWQKIGIPIDYLDIYYTFKRNVPPDLEYEANVAQKLKGIVSHETILNTLSFIDDPDFELLALEKEMGTVQLTNPNTPINEQYNLNNVPVGDAE